MIRSFEISAFFKCCEEARSFSGSYSPENGGMYVCFNTIPFFTFGVDLYTYDQIREMIFYLAGFGSADKCGKNTISIVLDYPVGPEDSYYDKLAFTFFDEVRITKAVDADFVKPIIGVAR